MRLRMLLIATAVILSACGSDSLDAPEYFAGLESARADYESELDDLDATFADQISAIDFEASEAEQQLAGLFRDQVNANSTAFREFVSHLSTLEPPGDLAAPHDDTIEAAEAVVAVFRDRQDDLNAINDLAAVDAFATDNEIADLRSRFVETCRELQALADQREISVDLSCGS